MDTSANTITTMGIISEEVYNADYFSGKLTTIKGTTYKVVDSTSNSSLSGFQALLLQKAGTSEYGNLSADTKEFIIIGNPINEMFTPIAIAETAIKERDDRIVILLQQAKDQSAQTGKHITFEYNKYLTYDRNGNLELRGVFVEERDVGFGLSNNALHEMYRYMSGKGISLNLSDYPMVPDSSDYVHTSSMNRVFDRTGLTEWLANREEWSPIDSRRDSHPNNPLNAETELLLLSAEDKTILHYLSSDYTIPVIPNSIWNPAHLNSFYPKAA